MRSQRIRKVAWFNFQKPSEEETASFAARNNDGAAALTEPRDGDHNRGQGYLSGPPNNALAADCAKAFMGLEQSLAVLYALVGPTWTGLDGLPKFKK
jgi:hypothetical protein